MRARGLKPALAMELLRGQKSRPMRARGLKQRVAYYDENQNIVAPHAGAWIETTPYIIPLNPKKVAPHAGAWIETFKSI